ncbi:MAG: indolepyruvate oxidoreductase subunit beta [Spirochaetaceae bacterium]|nr:MAG: indolepyruvate oxidoreductase subunit beta [Spirochaetaceae bacterium]
MDTNFLVVGVGGQGTILAGDILAEVGMSGGFDAKKSDILGLAIRSGSVVSHIRWGSEVHSPMSTAGQVDYLLAFEPLESLRMAAYLKADSTVIVNDYPIPPVAVTTGQMEYPSRERIDDILSAASGRYFNINVTEKATQLGNVKVVNIMLLGALSSLIDLPVSVWEQTIEKYVPSKLLGVNMRAFQAGRQLLE